MTDSTHGSYETIAGRPALRFERRLTHPVDAVWRAVSEPAELAHWFPQAVAFAELRAGADVVFTFPGEDRPSDTGHVVDADPPHLLAFTWFGDVLTFELEPIDGGAGTLLRFTQIISDTETAARTMAGWHLCLDMLAARLDGERFDQLEAPGTPTDAWRAVYDDYVARGVPSGAPIPGGG